MYTTIKDTENKNVSILLDEKTDLAIGEVEETTSGFIATPYYNNKPQGLFNMFYCACGYIGACTYRKRIRKYDKQLNLML